MNRQGYVTLCPIFVADNILIGRNPFVLSNDEINLRNSLTL